MPPRTKKSISECLARVPRRRRHKRAARCAINESRLAQRYLAAAKTVGQKPRPRGENVVDLMDALKKSLATEATTIKGKKPRKASSGQKEMLLPIEGKRGAEKKAAKPVRASGRRKAG